MNMEESDINLNCIGKGISQKMRTKHVHGIHPYLGKFIPQLPEIFIKKYRPKTVFDPFCGSGTTLVEAQSMGVNSIGCDVSEFSILLSKVKTDNYDIVLLDREIKDITKQFKIKNANNSLFQAPIMVTDNIYLNTWYLPRPIHELLLYKSLIKNYQYQDVMKIILSRAARSVRLVTHYELDFCKTPQRKPYYCYKHHRTCKPPNSAERYLIRYSDDVVKRIKEFSDIKNNAEVKLFCDDSKTLKVPNFDLIITSPPYLGLIDYHEQHRYSYELLGLTRKDDKEIGPSFKGQSKMAEYIYITKIYESFKNLLDYINEDGRIIIIIGDKKAMYPIIRERLGIIEEKKLSREVNMRTGMRCSSFFEDILIWKT
jgi:DNA modification methylase